MVEDIKDLEVISEQEAMALLARDENGRVLPIEVKHAAVAQPPLKMRKDEVIHKVFDGMAKIDIEDEITSMGIEKASKVLARLWTEKDIKIDHTITAMGLLGLFPVAQEVLE